MSGERLPEPGAGPAGDGVVERFEVVIIGSGFGGIGMAAALRRAGIGPVVVLEKEEHLGGVWRDNTYPGAACDVTSSLYSFSFHPGVWSRTYAGQAEILAYLEEVARTEGIDGDIRYGATVTELCFDARAATWDVALADGSRLEATRVISAVGQLNRPARPKIKGRKRFEGPTFHSARWDHDVDLRGSRVGIIGTGASVIQLAPRVAELAASTTIFQRSAPYLVPRHDAETPAWQRQLQRLVPATQLPSRARRFALGEVAARAVTADEHLRARLTAQSLAFLRHEITDPELLAKCTPDYELGCKRILISSEWYPTLRRDDVELVTDPIAKILRHAVRTSDGMERDLDVLIFGTGFKSTAFLSSLEVTGRDGAVLSERWREGASAYRGVAVPGFPNLFLLYGPNTNLGTNSIVYMLERQIEYLVALFRLAGRAGAGTLEVSERAQRGWESMVDEASEQTAYLSGCDSWYLRKGRNVNNWPKTTWRYGRLMAHVDLLDYDLRPARAATR